MIIIGELINSTRKKVGEAVRNQDVAYVQELARKQEAAGAAMLDVNGGVAGKEVEYLQWLVNIVQEVSDTPLTLDSSDPAALRAAIPLCKHRPMINSITDEPARIAAVLPLVKEYKTKVVALCMSEAGPPSEVDDRVATACRLVDRLTSEGIALDDIYVDACVLPISTGPEHGKSLMEGIRQIMARYPGVHTSAGLSNISFGVPVRKLMNQVFLMLLMAHGLDAAIADPLDRQLMANIRAAEALLGRDEFCGEYLQAFRKGLLEIAPAG